MEAKKNPKLDLDRRRVLFFNIGILLSLAIVIGAFEWKSYDEVALVEVKQEAKVVDEIIPITEIPPPEPPKPKVMVKTITEVTEEEEEEIEEIEIIFDQEEFLEYEPPSEEIEINVGEEETEEAFVLVEDMPEPIGGFQAFYAYVAENIEYPLSARRMGVEGRVFVQFIVEKDGRIVEPKVVRGIGAGCDEAAVEVVKNAPKWVPGEQRGKKVRVQMVVPINFTLFKNKNAL